MKQFLLMLVFPLMISCSKEEIKCPCIVVGIDKGMVKLSDNKLLLVNKRNGSVLLSDKDHRLISLTEPDPVALSIIHSRRVGAFNS